MQQTVPTDIRCRRARAGAASLVLAGTLLAAIAPRALAHGDHASAHATAGASAPVAATDYVGTVETLTVVDRSTNKTYRYPRLLLDDGRRVNLDGVAAPADGTEVSVTGRLDRHRLRAESLRARGQTASAGPPTNRTRESIEGTLHVFHIDYPDGNDDYGYTLRTRSGRQNVVAFGHPPASVDNGARAIVSGPTDARGYVTVDRIEITERPTAPLAKSGAGGEPSALTRGYTVFPLKYPSNTAAPWTYNTDPASWSIASITNAVLGNGTGSAADYYKEVSFGAQLLSGVVANASGAWLRATEARPTACGTSAQLNAVLNSIESNGQAAAIAAGFQNAINDNSGQLYVIDALPCGWLGLGYIGFPLAYTKGTASLIAVGHEIGHNFGLYHAGSLNCGSEVVASSGCSVAEYGDPFDVMGNRRTMHFNAMQKQRLGYLGQNGVATHASGTSTYTLYPLELGGQSRYAVRVAPTGTTRTYWIEFRQPIGFDSPLSGFPNLGAQVRLAYPFENQCSGCDSMSDDTQFLDMTRGTTSFDDGALLAGKSFTDSLNNITISVLAASSASLDVQVSVGGTAPTSTSTTLASSANPSTQGQSVTFTASVTGSAPTGSVTFKAGTNTISGCSAVALAGSGNTRSAACSTASLAAGVQGITAQYPGDAANAASTSPQVLQTVNSNIASTTTTLSSSINPAIQGQVVTFTATVAGSAPTGTVAFTDGASTLAGCGTVTLSGSGNSRTATCSTSALAVGSHAMTARYSGDAGNATSTSAQLTQTVNSAVAASTTTLVSSRNPATQGDGVTFTATVSGNAPAGTVAFADGATTLAGCGAVTLAGSGNSRTATCSTSALAVGSHAMTARYSGDAGNAASTSAQLTQAVNSAIVASTTVLASSRNPATQGDGVTFTATVSGNAPTGTVAFADGATTLAGCGAVTLAGSGNSRTATCSTSALAVGSHAMTARYSGDAGNAASTSAQLTQTVNSAVAASTTTLASSRNPATQGDGVTFTATVSGNAPAGTVAFADGATTLAGCGAVTLAGSGNSRTATCSTSALALGSHAMTARYSGDAGNAASTSAQLTQTIEAAPVASAITLASSTNPSTEGQIVTFTATITGAAPSGSVIFRDGANTIANCAAMTLAGNGNTRTAACATASFVPGTHVVTAQYAGDAANLGSNSPALTQTVNAAGGGGGNGPVTTTTVLATSVNPSNPGQNVTFTATVSGVAPTGIVAFRDGGNPIPACSAVTLNGSGNSRKATCTAVLPGNGSHDIAAAYGGDAGNAASASNTIAQAVLPSSSAIATAVTLASSANPAPATGAITLTATISAAPAVPGGTVSFAANGSTIAGCGNVSVVTSGVLRIAQCTTPLAPGALTIVATYRGSGQYQSSSSLPFAQVKSLPGIGNTIQFAAAGYAVNENAGSVTVTVTRIGDATGPAVASYTTASGTATSAEFEATSGTLTWAAQDASPRTITIPIKDEIAQEPDETFTVKLTAVTGATFGAVSTTTVTVVDNETSATAMPATATVVNNPYGALTVIGAAFDGVTLSNPTRNVDIELGTIAGVAGSMARIDFQGLSIGPGNTLRIRSGAPGQTVLLVNVSQDLAAVAGSIVAIQGNGAPPPALVVKSAPGVTLASSGRIFTPSGLTVDTLGADPAIGMPLENQGAIHGGTALTLKAARVNGGGIFRANAMTFVTFGNLNNPANGAHYLANGLQLHPASGNAIAVAIAGYGSSPQVYNLMLNGNGTVSMPSSWPAGSTLPANNRPVLPDDVRPAGVPDPFQGGGQVIVQASGNLTLDGGASHDFVFPGGFVLRANGSIDVNGTTLVNGWTTSGTTYQGIFLEASKIVDSSGAPALEVFTNDRNWANFSVRPTLPVRTATLVRQGDATARYVDADALAPHLNFYGLVTEAGAAGKCYTCLVNAIVMDFAAAP